MNTLKLAFLSLLVLICSLNDASAQIQTRIIGGQRAGAADYPYIVSLTELYNGTLSHFCGGSLIDKRWVLTAAHCVEGGLPFKVRIKSLDSTTGGEIIEPEFYRIPWGRIWNNVTGNDYDIALIKLSRDVTSVTPVKLAGLTENNLLVQGIMVSTAGWGITSLANPNTSRYLMKVNIPVANQSQCNSAYGNTISSAMLCAGGNGYDSCGGDSGGPLVLSDSSGKYLAGLVSFGHPQCGIAGYPGVYTRISSHLDWIKSISGVGAPAKVVMITQSGSTQDTSPYFSWNVISGAESYRISVSISGGTSSFYTSTTPSYTLPEGIQGRYTIKVSAKSGSYYGEYSNPLVLDVYKIPTASAVLSITNGQRLNTFSPAITWRASTNAKTYNLVVRNLTTQRDFNVNGLTGTAYTYPNNLTAGKYNITVVAVNGTQSATSTLINFYINLSSPKLNAIVGNSNKRPTFSWTAVSGATKYRLYLENLNTKVIQDLPNITGTSYVPSSNLASGAYRAYVMALNSDVNSLWSAASSFSINFDAPVFTIVSTGVKRPKVSWSAIAGATKYEVYFKSVTTPTDILSVVVTGTSYIPTRDLRIGAQDVWMRVVSTGVVGNWSAPKRIIVK